MKYYSKSPSEFRRDLEESAIAEQSKKKKSYLLQIANFGVLAVAVVIMMKAPELMKGNKEEGKPAGVEKNMSWKGWSAESNCKPAENCTLELTRNGKEMTVDAFFWKVTKETSGEVALKTFELIPKDMKINETRSFQLPLAEDSGSQIVTVHFMDNRNEELLSMQIFP